MLRYGTQVSNFLSLQIYPRDGEIYSSHRLDPINHVEALYLIGSPGE
jgi:hypothetical protein